MTGHPGRRKRPTRQVTETWRTHQRGVPDHRAGRGERAVLPGDPRHATPRPRRPHHPGGRPRQPSRQRGADALGNLGVEVIDVEEPAATPRPRSAENTSSLADLLSRRPWRVIAIAVAFLAVAVMSVDPSPATSRAPGSRTRTPSSSPPATPPHASAPTPTRGSSPWCRPAATSAPARAGRRSRRRRHHPHGPGRRPGRHRLQRRRRGADLEDGTQSYIAVFMKPIPTTRRRTPPSGSATRSRASRREVGGADGGRRGGRHIIGEDLAKAESFAFPMIFLLSLWVFRGVVAALLPSLMGGLVIFGSFLAIGLSTRR